jgi:hypothetical protein
MKISITIHKRDFFNFLNFLIISTELFMLIFLRKGFSLTSCVAIYCFFDILFGESPKESGEKTEDVAEEK